MVFPTIAVFFCVRTMLFSLRGISDTLKADSTVFTTTIVNYRLFPLFETRCTYWGELTMGELSGGSGI